MFIQLPRSPLVLETGSDELLAEDGSSLITEDSVDGAVQVLDEVPVLAVPYYYWHPSIFFQMEPLDQVNPVYLEAWQNLPATLMPEYSTQYLYGDILNYPYFFMQLAPPIFPPDGKRVASPTSTKAEFRGFGRTRTTRRPG